MESRSSPRKNSIWERCSWGSDVVRAMFLRCGALRWKPGASGVHARTLSRKAQSCCTVHCAPLNSNGPARNVLGSSFSTTASDLG